jgi:hypothetical protein
MHFDWPAFGWYVPASQGVCSKDFVDETKFPASAGMQDFLPVAGWYVPIAQGFSAVASEVAT